MMKNTLSVTRSQRRTWKQGGSPASSRSAVLTLAGIGRGLLVAIFWLLAAGASSQGQEPCEDDGLPPGLCYHWDVPTCSWMLNPPPAEGCLPGSFWDGCNCVPICPDQLFPAPPGRYEWNVVACDWLSFVHSCDSGWFWWDPTCACEPCATEPVGSVPPIGCYKWSAAACGYVAIEQPPDGCGAHMKWDLSLCTCVPDCPESFLPTPPYCARWDTTLCDWVSLELEANCGAGSHWNEGTCSCLADCWSATYMKPTEGCWEWNYTSCSWDPQGTVIFPGFHWNPNTCSYYPDCWSGAGQPEIPCSNWDPMNCTWVPPEACPSGQLLSNDCTSCVPDCTNPPGEPWTWPTCSTWFPNLCAWVSDEQITPCGPGYKWDSTPGSCGCKWDCNEPDYDRRPPGCFGWNIAACDWVSLITPPPEPNSSYYYWDDMTCSYRWNCMAAPDPSVPQTEICSDWNGLSCSYVPRPIPSCPGMESCFTYDPISCDWRLNPCEYTGLSTWDVYPSPDFTLRLSLSTPLYRDVFLDDEVPLPPIEFSTDSIPAELVGSIRTAEAHACASDLITPVTIIPTETWTISGITAPAYTGSGNTVSVKLTEASTATVTFNSVASNAAPSLTNESQTVAASVNALKLAHTVRATEGVPPPKDPYRTTLLPGEIVDLGIEGSPGGQISWRFEYGGADQGTLTPGPGNSAVYTAPPFVVVPMGGMTVKLIVDSISPIPDAPVVSKATLFKVFPILIDFESVGDNERITENKYIDVNKQLVTTGKKWMPGLGFRIFPDAKSPSDATARNRLKLRIQIAPGSASVLYLGSLDVDDPSEDPDGVLDDNDGSTHVNGDDNLTTDNLGLKFPGVFASNGEPSLTVDVGNDGIATLPGGGDIEFIVGMQPGDNYRIAASFNQEGSNGLGTLHVHSSVPDGYVSADDMQPKSFNGIVSPLLTVWRLVHVEVDSMSKWEGQKPGPDQTKATGAVGGWNRQQNTLTLIQPLPEGNDFYEGGMIRSGAVFFNILSNTATTIKVAFSQLPTDDELKAFEGHEFEVLDDDDRKDTNLGTIELLPRTHIISDWVRGCYNKAYIDLEEVPIFTPGFNLNPITPFKQNFALLGLYDSDRPLYSHQDMNSAGNGSVDRKAYWYCFLGVGYQFKTDHDGDPNAGGYQMGQTISGLPTRNISAVFLETIRDQVMQAAPNDVELSFERRLARIVAHELGHQPGRGEGSDHAELGLMGAASSRKAFSPASIKRFRTAEKWER